MKPTAALAFSLAALAGSACGASGAPPADAGIDAVSIDAVACAGLDLASCRRTTGCVADLCPACECDLLYRGCLSGGEQPAACPDLACPTRECCRMEADCQGAMCVAPDELVCGGACNPQPDECMRDADCRIAPGAADGRICEPVPCACNGGARQCVDGCTLADDCDEGESCDRDTGRCAPRACGVGAPCPPDFDCGHDGCTRRPCTADGDCDNFCVEDLCRGALGSCQLPPP